MPRDLDPEFRAALVQGGALPAAGIDACVLLPGPDCALPGAVLRQLRCCALVRLTDATVWLLRARGVPWSESRVAAAARVLRDARRRPDDPDALCRRLRRELRVPSAVVLPALPPAGDTASWDLRATAVVLGIRMLRAADGPTDPVAFAAATARIEDSLRATLDPALAAFHATTDREALDLALAASGGADLGLYNFLVEAEHRAWRQQFARTFPIFLRAAATGGAGTVGESIRAAVDAGVPLVRHLATRWGVGTGVIRCLRNRGAALIGARWENNVRGLARLLDALRADDRPQDDAAQWQHFNRLVATAERIFRCPPWASPAAQAWLREAMRQGGADIDEAAAQRYWSPAAIAAVQRFRDGLARFLELESVARQAAPGAATCFTFEGLADRFVATRAPRRLTAIAERFDRHRRDPPAAVVQESALLAGDRYWPLLAADLASADGTRIVASLATRAALGRHGDAMHICLTGSYLGSPGIEARGTVRFILGILDAADESPASTAEIRVARRLGAGGFDVEILQHKGPRNHQPSRGCAKALDEALVLARSPAGQRHLEEGFHALRGRGSYGEAAARLEAERMMLTEILGRTLGPAALAELAAGSLRQIVVADGAMAE